MLTIRELKMTLGGRTLFENASFQLNYGDRVALVGPNGAGKTTLFSLILKEKSPDSGVIERDEWTMVGYLPQEGEAQGDETVLDVATGRVEELPLLERRLHELEAAGNVSSPEYMEAHAKHDALNDPQVETKAKKMLRGLGYRDADFERKAREMSGGWIMRARLARLLVMEPDLLLLDEPTNHLDLLALLWLQNYLKNYPGALLLISHDRQFMDEVVGQVHEIADKKLIAYAGNYTDTMTKAMTAMKGGQAPQLSVLLSTDVFTLMDENAIVPMDGLVADESWFKEFYPAFMANGQIDGKGEAGVDELLDEAERVAASVAERRGTVSQLDAGYAVAVELDLGDFAFDDRQIPGVRKPPAHLCSVEIAIGLRARRLHG